MLFPQTVDEAIDYLQRHNGQAHILAGGTDLLVKIKTDKARFPYLISLRQIQEIKTDIKIAEDQLFIGPLVTMADVYQNLEVQRNFPALCQAAYLMGSQQIRNRATVVGNICNASPAAETAAPLLIYEASVCLKGPHGVREIPIGKFFKGPGETHKTHDEIVTGIRLPLPIWHEKSIYKRISRRRGVDLAIVNVALAMGHGGKTKLAYGSLAPVPFRALSVESVVNSYLSHAISEEEFTSAVEKCLSPIDDIRSSRVYKIEMAKLLTLEGVHELTGREG